MADARAKNQSHAPDVDPRRRGHDLLGRFTRSRNFTKLTHSLQREFNLCKCTEQTETNVTDKERRWLRPFYVADVHRIHFGGCQPLPDPADLHGRSNQTVQRTQDRRVASAHIRHRRQLLHANETLRTGSMHRYQVRTLSPVQWHQRWLDSRRLFFKARQFIRRQ